MAHRRLASQYDWAPLGRFTTKRELRDGPRVIGRLRRRGIWNHWTFADGPGEWPIQVKGIIRRRLLLNDPSGLLASLQDDMRDRASTVSWRDGRTFRWKQTSVWRHGEGVLTVGETHILRVFVVKGGHMTIAVEGDGATLTELEVAQLVALFHVFLLSPAFNPFDIILPG